MTENNEQHDAAREELLNLIGGRPREYDLEDMAAELQCIAGAVIVQSTVCIPKQFPEGSPSAETVESSFDSISQHILRVADALTEYKGKLLEAIRSAKEGA